MTVLEGGYEFGPKNKTLSPDDVGIRGEIILFLRHLNFPAPNKFFS